MNEQLPDAPANELQPSRGPLVLGFFALLAVVVIWGLWVILKSFITPILLAVVIVVLTFPLYVRLRTKLRRRDSTAALLMLLGVTIVIILPSLILIGMLIDQATTLVVILQKSDVTGAVSRFDASGYLQSLIPGVRLPKIDFRGALLTILRQMPALVATKGGALLGRVADLVMGYFFMLFAMFYFYSDGESLLRHLKYLSPLPDKYDDELIMKFKQVIDATFRGHVLTAFAQGALTGIGLAICGIPGGVFWAAVATVFAMVPLVGAAIVWGPAAIYLFLDAGYHHTSMAWGIFLLVWGAGPVSLIDNVIRPWAMKGGAEMPAVLLLFSILGGVKAFGFMGILLGPLIFALVISVIQIYKDFFGSTLDGANSPPTDS